MSNVNNSSSQNTAQSRGETQPSYNPYGRRISDLIQGYNWSPEYFPINAPSVPIPTEPNYDFSNIIAQRPADEIGPLSTSALSSNLAMSSQDAPDSVQKPMKRITTGKHKRTASAGPSKRPVFVLKLWNILNDPKNHEYIQWTPDGQNFTIMSKENFENIVLPKYFKHKNYSSFVRQLNMYGWHKVQDAKSGTFNSKEEVRQFHSPNFIRGREDLLDNIVRNKATKGSDDEDETDLGKILDELDLIKNNQMEIAADLNRIRKDNQMLWRECYDSRERHKTHAETFERILRFLASLYSTNQNKFVTDNLSTPQKQQRLLLPNMGDLSKETIAEVSPQSNAPPPTIEEIMSSNGSPSEYAKTPAVTSHRISTVSTDDGRTGAHISEITTPQNTAIPKGNDIASNVEDNPPTNYNSNLMEMPNNYNNNIGLDYNTALQPDNLFNINTPSSAATPVTSALEFSAVPTTSSLEYAAMPSASAYYNPSYPLDPSGMAPNSLTQPAEDPLGMTPLVSNALYQSNDGWMKANDTAQHIAHNADDIESIIRNIDYQGDSLKRIQDRIKRYSASAQGGHATAAPLAAAAAAAAAPNLQAADASPFDVDEFLKNSGELAEDPAPGAPPVVINDDVDQLRELERYEDMAPPSKKVKRN